MDGSKEQMGLQRDIYFDFVRGLSIIFVIGIHAHFGKYQANDKLTVVIRQIIGVAVPVFIALSGYFTTSKHEVTPKSFVSNFWGAVQHLGGGGI